MLFVAIYRNSRPFDSNKLEIQNVKNLFIAFSVKGGEHISVAEALISQCRLLPKSAGYARIRTVAATACDQRKKISISNTG